MLDRVLEVLDKNKPWKVFRHGSSFVNLLKVLGIWPKIVGPGALVVGAFVAYLAALPLWGKILVALVVATLLSIIALVLTIQRALTKTRTTPPDTPADSGAIDDPITADRNMLQALQAVFPSSAIAALRMQSMWHTFKWPFDRVLADFEIWGTSPDHRFLADALETIHAKLRKRAHALRDGVLRYSEELPGQEKLAVADRSRGFSPLTGSSKDAPEREFHRNEMWQAKDEVGRLYEELLLAGRRQFSGVELPPQSAAATPSLVFVNWFGSSGTHLPPYWPTPADHPLWICVRNVSDRVAEKVRASIEFVNPSKPRCDSVPEAIWWEIGGKTPNGNDRVPHAQHVISIQEGDEQYFLLWARDGNNQVIPYKNAAEPLDVLERGDWEARIAVLSDNVAGFEIVLNISVTRDGGGSRNPFIARRQQLPSRLDSIRPTTENLEDRFTASRSS